MSGSEDQLRLQEHCPEPDTNAIEDYKADSNEQLRTPPFDEAEAERERERSFSQAPIPSRELSRPKNPRQQQGDSLVGASGRMEGPDGGYVTIPSESSASEDQEEIGSSRPAEAVYEHDSAARQISDLRAMLFDTMRFLVNIKTDFPATRDRIDAHAEEVGWGMETLLQREGILGSDEDEWIDAMLRLT